MIDSYEVNTGSRFMSWIKFDEDSYAVECSASMQQFLNLDFEFFKATCEENGWTYVTR